ncbi:MAG: aldose 1-epimerase [Clostridia bacterium]|nr:aldose 1-epimerase [Clostridia bacterium]
MTFRGENVLNPLENEELLKSDPCLFGAPVLMPSNRTYEGRFTFEGREYTLPLNEKQNNCHIHGLVMFNRFETISCDENSAVLRFSDRENISYPFPFELKVKYSLTDDGLYSAYELKNIGQGNMPFTFGLHTTFSEPDSFSCPISLCQEKDAHHIPTGRYIPLNEQEQRYALASPSRGVVISGYYLADGNIAHIGEYEYRVSDNFDHWILFNRRGECGFLCVEPQSGGVNGLNIPDGHKVLAPNETICFETFICRACDA